MIREYIDSSANIANINEKDHAKIGILNKISKQTGSGNPRNIYIYIIRK